MLARGGRRRQLPRTAAVAGLLWLLVFLVYVTSPISQISDSWYTLLVSEHLFTRGNFELDEHFPPFVDDAGYPGVRRRDTGLPRHVRRSQDHLYPFYPLGSAVLTTPLLPLAWSLGAPRAIKKDGRYDRRSDAFAQRPLASFVTSLAVVLVFAFAALRLPLPQAFLVASCTALSTQFWSTASRGLWSHTWLVVLLGAVCWLVLRHEVRGTPLRPVLLATALSWCFFVRPASVCLILAFTAYVWMRSRRDGLVLSAVGAAWAGAFIAFSFAHYGSWLPQYYAIGSSSPAFELRFGNLLIAIPGQWISPSRGLLVFVPLVAWLAWLGFRVRATVGSRALVASVLAGVAVTSLSMGTFDWWGGSSYGPRLQTDLVPVFALLAVLFVHAAGQRADRSVSRPLRRSECIAMVAAVVVGVVLNGAGAWSTAGARWNRYPNQQERAFEVVHSQWMVALFPSLLESIAPPEPERPPPNRR